MRSDDEAPADAAGLHGSLRDRAVANGVDADDPALAACREGPGWQR